MSLASSSNSANNTPAPVPVEDETAALLTMAKAFCDCTRRFNRYQWEYPWYMYWSTALATLFPEDVEGSSVFTAPQFPLSADQLDEKRLLKLPDFCMLYLSGHPSIVSDPAMALSFEDIVAEDFRGNWTIDDVSILIILEVKSLRLDISGLDMDGDNLSGAIYEHYKYVFRSAKNQVYNQAAAFFSNPIHEDMDAIVGMLAVDDMWSWVKLERTIMDRGPLKSASSEDLSNAQKRKGKGKQFPSMFKPASQPTKLELIKSKTNGLHDDFGEQLTWSEVLPWNSSKSHATRAEMLQMLRKLHPNKKF